MSDLDARISIESFLALSSRVKAALHKTKAESERALAEDFLRFFRKSLREGKLRLVRLSETTIQDKRNKGYSRPEVPMYGMGDSSDRSYINLISVRRTQKGFRVGPIGSMKHHGGMTIHSLAVYHAEGAKNLPKRNPLANAKKIYFEGRNKSTVRSLAARILKRNMSR